MMSPSVLVIENYADLRSSIVEALERRKFSCDSVGTSEDAVLKLRDHHYEAILIAPMVPITDDPVIHYLAANQPGEMHKVIVMSDPATPTGECGALLEKPFTNDELVQCVRARR